MALSISLPLKSLPLTLNRPPLLAFTPTHATPASPPQLRIKEEELGSEKVHLGLVNDGNSKMMLKCNVPLSGLVPEQHYGLRLLMKGGPLNSSVAL